MSTNGLQRSKVFAENYTHEHVLRSYYSPIITRYKYLNVSSCIYVVERTLSYYFSRIVISPFADSIYSQILFLSMNSNTQCRTQAISRFSLRFIFLIFPLRKCASLSNLSCKRTSKNPTADRPRHWNFADSSEARVFSQRVYDHG